MRKWIGAGITLTVLWLFVRGVKPGYLVNELIIGAGIGFFTAYMLRRMFTGEINLNHWLSVSPKIFQYIGNFTKELLTANLDVAKRVILPNSSINPDVVEVDLRIQNPAAITVLANSITLTPGTLTMDYNEDRSSLYVHGITAGIDREGVLQPIKHWENLLIEIFKEEVKQ